MLSFQAEYPLTNLTKEQTHELTTASAVQSWHICSTLCNGWGY